MVIPTVGRVYGCSKQTSFYSLKLSLSIIINLWHCYDFNISVEGLDSKHLIDSWIETMHTDTVPCGPILCLLMSQS